MSALSCVAHLHSPGPGRLTPLGSRRLRCAHQSPRSTAGSHKHRGGRAFCQLKEELHALQGGAKQTTIEQPGPELVSFSLPRRALLLSSLPCGCLACGGATAASVPPRNQWRDSFFAQAMNSGMGEYETLLQPVKAALFADVLGAYGEQAVKVVEIGIGTAPNLKYYPLKSVEVVGVDPNAAMAPYAYKTASGLGLPETNFSVVEGIAESLPLPDNSADVVVGTLVMCSVPNVRAALAEIKRVLKPGGKYLFIEHVAAPDGTWKRVLQNVFNPLQIAIADGCHLNRQTGAAIQGAEFKEVELQSFDVPELSIIGPHVAGVATA